MKAHLTYSKWLSTNAIMLALLAAACYVALVIVS
jgi:hypothetical protein